ncbi:MAG: hypothetical protein R8K49_06115, partial [Mariprofundaceae bacterium]
MSWINDLKVSHRLGMIGMISLLGMLLIGFLHMRSLDHLEVNLNSMLKSASLMEEFDSLTGSVFEQQSLINQFLLSGGAAKKQRWQELSSGNDKVFKDLESELPTSELREAAKQLDQHLNAYNDK